MSDKIEVESGSTVKIIREGDEWRVEVLHKGGGITGQMGRFKTFKEAAEYVQMRYDVDG